MRISPEIGISRHAAYRGDCSRHDGQRRGPISQGSGRPLSRRRCPAQDDGETRTAVESGHSLSRRVDYTRRLRIPGNAYLGGDTQGRHAPPVSLRIGMAAHLGGDLERFASPGRCAEIRTSPSEMRDSHLRGDAQRFASPLPLRIVVTAYIRVSRGRCPPPSRTNERAPQRPAAAAASGGGGSGGGGGGGCRGSSERYPDVRAET